MPFIKGAKQWVGGWIIHRCPSVKKHLQSSYHVKYPLYFLWPPRITNHWLSNSMSGKTKAAKKNGNKAKPSLCQANE